MRRRTIVKSLQVVQVRNDEIGSLQQQRGFGYRTVVLKLWWISNPLEGLLTCRFLVSFDSVVWSRA